MADLTAAIAAGLRVHSTEQAQASETTSAPSDFDLARIVTFSDGKQIRTTLLVVPVARIQYGGNTSASRMHHDYKRAALTAEVAPAAPHGQVAPQIFLPDGPLALLPLPKPCRAALIWSLPARKAQGGLRRKPV